MVDVYANVRIDLKSILLKKKSMVQKYNTVWSYSNKKNSHKIITYIFIATYTNASQNINNAQRKHTKLIIGINLDQVEGKESELGIIEKCDLTWSFIKLYFIHKALKWEIHSYITGLFSNPIYLEKLAKTKDIQILTGS